MTATQKGHSLQVRTANHLKKLGMQVHTVTRPTHRGGSHDFFGLWDHIAISHQDSTVGNVVVPAGETLYVQTKSRKIYGVDALPFIEFPGRHKLCFVWTKQDNGRYIYNLQIF